MEDTFREHDPAAAASTYPVPDLAIKPSRSDNVGFRYGLHFRHDLCILLHMAFGFALHTHEQPTSGYD